MAVPDHDPERARPNRRWLAWSIVGFSAVVVAVGSVLLLVGYATGDLTARTVIGQFALLPPAASFSVVGLIVALKHPRNACGWLMLAIGAMWSVGVSPPTPDDHWTTWALGWGWVPPFGLMATHLPLRLPDGHLPSRRWRWVSRLSTTAIVVTCVGFLFDTNVASNPIANAALSNLALVGILTMGVCAILSIASLVVRSRRAGSDERHQIRWIAIGATIFIGSWAAILAISWTMTSLSEGPDLILSTLALALYSAIPVSSASRSCKYRLYDIDVVIRKTVVAAVLAAFLVLVYVGIVVGGRGDRRGSGCGERVVPDRCRRRRRRAPVPAAPHAGSPARGPGRLRHARDAVRGARGVRRTAWPGRTRPTTCCPGWRRVLGEGVGADRARVWLRGRRRPGRVVATWPARRRPTSARRRLHEPRCVTRASCSARCRSRCRRTTRWTRRRRSSSATSRRRPGSCCGTCG